TFNYDSMLEQAVRSVFGLHLSDMDKYATHQRIHIYKPHGSVTWRQEAGWDMSPGSWLDGVGGLNHAIDIAPALRWGDRWAYGTDDQYQDPQDATTAWLPALSIPVRSKSEFTMPEGHRVEMVADLAKVTTMIAVGWRARERHFLQLLQDEMPSRPARLVAVAESTEAAQETVNNLWETGRFNSYAISSLGFSGFTETPNVPHWERATVDKTQLRLQDVLSAGPQSGIWTDRTQGTGLAPDPTPTALISPGYVDL
ncbi:MAG: SIR2 family protein, partial [Nocardioides sp.]